MFTRRDAEVKPRQVLGFEGEEIAVTHLTGIGFRILERNFRTRWGEIDIIAAKKKEYYFVEVKTRRGLKFGEPIDVLPFYRVERLKKMSLLYAAQKKLLEKPLHVSLLGIDLSQSEPKITFLTDIVD